MSGQPSTHDTKGSGDSSSRARDIPALTLLRIFAALLVVFSHHYVYWPFQGEFFTSFLVPFVSHGDVGVKIFFILSGFILTHAYGDHKTVDKREFFLARFARIYPMYLFGLVISIPVLLLVQIPELVARYGTSLGLVVTAVKSMCVLLLLQSWIPPTTDHWNGVSWSLSTEAFFYTVFPWVMPWMRKLRDRNLWLLIAIGVVLETMRTMSVATASSHLNAEVLTFFPVLRLADFFTGIAICLLYRRGTKIHPAWSLLGVGTLILGTEIASKSFLGYTLMHLGSATLVASLASSNWSARSMVSKTGVLLGFASYGAYLIHQPLGFLMSLAMTKFTSAKLPYPVYFLTLLVASSLLYVYLETPARQWIRKRFSKKNK